MTAKQILTLLELPGIGRKSIIKLLQVKSDILADSYDNCIELINRISPKLASKMSEDLFNEGAKNAEEIIDSCHKLSIMIITYGDDNYPSPYYDLDNDAPPILYAKGNISSLNVDKRVAIIGTRKISQSGITAGEMITKEFVAKGYTVVSGLAIGCDTIAHETCLKNNGTTIAIMPCGLEQVYPKSNTELAEEITLKGCLLSEYPPGTKIMNNFFVERDRLQSGLSQAVVVIETDIKGGTLHTVKFGTDQGRKIACVKYRDDLLLSTNAGNRMLIESGKATGLTSKNINQFIDGLSVSKVSSNVQTKLDI